MEDENPSKRKELEGDTLTRVLKEIRECRDCKFIGFGEYGDPDEYQILMNPCPIHKEKVKELI